MNKPCLCATPLIDSVNKRRGERRRSNTAAVKSVFKKTLCLALIILTLMGTFTVNGFAASNVCSSAKGNSAKTATFQVITGGTKFGAKPSITLSQSKGKMKIYVLRLDGKDYHTTKQMYEYYYVTLRNMNNGRVQKIKWNGSQTKKINLDKNSRYQITVEPYAVKHKDDFTFFGPALNPYPWGIFPFKCWAPRAWVNNCSWKVASCNHIKSCN